MYSISLFQVQLQKLKPSANFVIYALICCKFSKIEPLKSILVNQNNLISESKNFWFLFLTKSVLNLDVFDFKICFIP